MKKIFTLASVAVLFAACSDKTTEEVLTPAGVTRAVITVDPATAQYGCNKRGVNCELVQYLQAGGTLIAGTNGGNTADSHWHCTLEGCDDGYYNNYFLSEQEALDHLALKGHHGGVASYE